MSDGHSTLGSFMAAIFLIPALIFGWTCYKAWHPPAPSIPVDYESNAIPMTWIDQCGDAPVCVWWWQYDDGTGTINPDTDLPEMPGWQLHYGPHADVPAGARPVRSLPVLAVQP